MQLLFDCALRPNGAEQARFSHMSRASQTRQPLTARETQVFEIAVLGRTNKDIALELNISPRTVKFHMANLFQKCCVTSRLELIVQAREQPGPMITFSLGK